MKLLSNCFIVSFLNIYLAVYLKDSHIRNDIAETPRLLKMEYESKNLSFNIGNKKNLKFDSIFMNPPYFDKETVNESKSHYQSITKYHGGSNLDKRINNSLQL